MEPFTFKTSGFFSNWQPADYSPTTGVTGSALEMAHEKTHQTQPVEESKPIIKEVKPKEPKPQGVKKVEQKETHSQESSGLTKEYFFDTSSPIELNPVWGATRTALGLAVESAGSNEVSNIARFAATLLQDDSPVKVFNFLSKKLSSMPQNVGNPIYWLQKSLTFELEKKLMKGGRN
ncbi:MAG: hypothetical protein G01um10147_783 [Microgenomates group bacterium Gr01-1014_7]|nr:MAG: hypothetical protein G01um10147_783 [Microgenomates group bacterium Gr01-1014_7]